MIQLYAQEEDMYRNIAQIVVWICFSKLQYFSKEQWFWLYIYYFWPWTVCLSRYWSKQYWFRNKTDSALMTQLFLPMNAILVVVKCDNCMYILIILPLILTRRTLWTIYGLLLIYRCIFVNMMKCFAVARILLLWVSV